MTAIQKLTLDHADSMKREKQNLTKFFTFRVTGPEYSQIRRNGGGKWLRSLLAK